jgi:hypothetical protein
MAPTTTPIRANTKARLKALLVAKDITRDGGAKVQVVVGFPGRDLEDECIWIGNTSGPRSVAALKSARKRVHDDFTVDVWVIARASGQGTPEEAEARCEELMGYVCDVVADDPHLPLEGVDLDGLTGGAAVADVTGPDAEPTDEGYVALARIEIRCQASLA